MGVTCETGARLHVGFQNLSLDRPRLFGSLGIGLEEPRVVITAEPAPSIQCDHDLARGYAERAVALLDLEGAAVTVESSLPRHVGLGSGTQLALATLTAIACAHDRDPRVRERAPALGRGLRSGIGVATFEAGGFVLDAGRRTGRFLSERTRSEGPVPPVILQRAVPSTWRIVLVHPDLPPGRSGGDEDRCLTEVMDGADPAITDENALAVAGEVLPGIVADDLPLFGDGIETVDRGTGSWFGDRSDGADRGVVGSIVESLADAPAIAGTGQSSWGPTVYGVTTADRAEEATAAGRAALSEAGITGQVEIVDARNQGAITDKNV